MLSNQQIQKNWPQIKSQLLSKWNKLSEADVEQTHGSASSLGSLVKSKYGSIKDFDKTYEKICESCIPSSRNITVAKNDIENRSATAPAGEAGLHNTGTEEKFHTGAPEDFSSYTKAYEAESAREGDDELSAYSSPSTRTSIDDGADEEYMKLDNQESNTKFTTPDEFYPSQDPSPSREDITLGRNTSSATKLSTAKAAPISSEVSSNDAKKKI